jgi:hypothetical protein
MKSTKRTASKASATGEQQLAGFVNKFDSKNAAFNPFHAESLAQAPADSQ